MSRPTALESELALRDVAAGQRQVFTAEQARLAGWNRQRLHRWRCAERIEQIHRGVYRFAGSSRTWSAAVYAAVLACGPGAVASHRSALALHGIEPARRDQRTPVEVSIPAGRDIRPSGVVVHRVALPPDHVTVVDGIPCTTYERTLIDNAAKLGPRQLAGGLDQGLVTRQVTVPSVGRAVESTARSARAPTQPGGACRRRPDDRVSNARGSPREIRLLAALRAADLPAPVPQYRVDIDDEVFHLDAAYPQFRIGIEYQGFDEHRTRRAFDADHRRFRLLTLAGWSILYFTSATTDGELVEHVTRLVAASRQA